jgi:hypothetical protein
LGNELVETESVAGGVEVGGLLSDEPHPVSAPMRAKLASKGAMAPRE